MGVRGGGDPALVLPADGEPEGEATMTVRAVWQHRHVLDLDDFTREELELVLETAREMRRILEQAVPQVPALRGRTVVNLFYEPSTRTRISFERAAKALSANVINMSAASSSVVKGESLIDTVRTLRALGADLLVIRHPHAGAPYLAARHFPGSVLNAGDGRHAHPTQGLLDLFTLWEQLGSLEGRKVVIVGDVLHSRVARSNLWGLGKMGARVVLCGPPTLVGRREEWTAAGYPSVEVEYDLDRALEGAEVVMALRLQKERQAAGLLPEIREYVRRWGLTPERLNRARPDVILMHPGPVNEGIELTPDLVVAPQSKIAEQVTNGVAVRMALLYLLSGVGEG